MNSKQFLSEFKYIIARPESIGKIREMILLFGVSGRLVENVNIKDFFMPFVSSEAPLIVEKKPEKKRINWKEHHGNYSFYFPLSIPKNWTIAKLNNIAIINMGQSPDGTSVNQIPGNGLPFYQGKTEFGVLYPIPMKWCEKPKKIAIKDDILLSVRAPVGPTNLCEEESCIGRGITAISVVKDIDKFYVLYVLRALEKYIAALGVGSNFTAISQQGIQGIPIPIPPVEEQKRIVSKINEMMSLCDQLEAQQKALAELSSITRTSVLSSLSTAKSSSNLNTSWNRLKENISVLFNEPENVEQLKLTILELAVFGKLNLRGSVISADDRLQRIQAKKTDLVNKKLIKRETPVVDFAGVHELRIDIPETWIWCRLNDIASIVRGGSPRPAGDPQFYGGNIPFLKVADITRSKGMFIENFTSTIKEEGLKKTREITQRTVLLTNSGATLGVPAICNFRTTFNDGIAAFIELAEEVLDEYLYFYLKAKSKWLLDIASRGQGQPNLNTDIIKSMWFPLPPMAEQRAIVDKTKRMLSLCEQLATNQKNARTVAEAFASAYIASITGIQVKDKDKMKAPKTELVSTLRIGVSPTNREQAPLAAILIRNNGEMPAKTLWQTSGDEIDVFYQQLKTEMAKGWIMQPELAHMREMEVS